MTNHLICQLTISKKGDVVKVLGEIQNVWKDRYDWNPGMTPYIPGFGDVSDDDGIYLKRHGGAKDYDLRSFWKTSISQSQFTDYFGLISITFSIK